MSEEAFSLKSCGKLLMKSKFLAVVAGYGMNLFLVRERCSDKSLGDTGRPFITGKGDNAETGLPFNQGDKDGAAPATDHCIRLPVADPGSFFSNIRTLVCRRPILYPASPICASITFFLFFRQRR
jgi:hypothetical protein